jgi:hypothetical protein
MTTKVRRPRIMTGLLVSSTNPVQYSIISGAHKLAVAHRYDSMNYSRKGRFVLDT